MRYASIFSGIGGLESAKYEPQFFCEKDPACQIVLSERHPNINIVEDIKKTPDVRIEVCVGGWPCQDLTSAGRQKGINGDNSSLFFEMVEFAKRSHAETFIGENVPNLIRIRGGSEFKIVISTLSEAGYKYISWRVLNAREFGLPQDRNRLIIVASRNKNVALNLHRSIRNEQEIISEKGVIASGFYWTGGLQSICYSEDYIPALKVGASPPKGGTSPVAVVYGDIVRKLSPIEALSLQGFVWKGFAHVPKDGDIYRMAGNAVPRPMGAFAVDTATFNDDISAIITSSHKPSGNGCYLDGELYDIKNDVHYSSRPLSDFLDLSSSDSLSPQASAGLLSRLIRSNRKIPLSLFNILYDLSMVRTPLKGTKVDSFKILHEDLDVKQYLSYISK